MQLQSGTSLGSYKILSPLGKGGMGEVYRARDRTLEREVAIKVLPEDFASSDERLARFEREAKSLAALNHPNIATVHGFEQDGDVRYLVMELVEGEELAERIARGPIPVDEAIPLFIQIAEGLEAAHEKGLIHRDLKPSNIKVGNDGRVRILDFGLAKGVPTTSGYESAPSESPTITYAATLQGQILGTAAYMAPEQAKGQQLDRRADIWAFGVCLYEAIAGRRAFQEVDAGDTLAAVLRAELSWDALPADTPPAVRRLLRRCIRRDSKDRLHDIADARIELQEALLLEGTGQGSAREARTSAPAVFLALAAAFAAGLGASHFFLEEGMHPRERSVVRSVLSTSGSPVEMGRFWADVAISPDGETVVYTTADGLHRRRVDELDGVVLPQTARAKNPFFSPDGQWVGFGDQRSALRRTSIQGGEAETLYVTTSWFPGAAWLEDGRIVFQTQQKAGGGNPALMTIAETGGPIELLLAPRGDDEGVFFPAMLPEQRGVLYSFAQGGSTGLESQSVAVLDVKTGDRTELVRGGGYARYSRSGHLLYAVPGAIRAIAFDIDELEVRGDPVTVVAGVATKSGSGNFDLSATGSLVYVKGDPVATETSSLVWVYRDGRVEPIVEEPRHYVYPSLSPDGTKLAVDFYGGTQDIWVWDLVRETFTRLTSGISEDVFSVWTPDSREIFFSSARTGDYHVYRTRADGSTSPSLVVVEEDEATYPQSLSSDGRLLVYRTGAAWGHDLGVVDLTSGAPGRKILADPVYDERNGEISPDGRWIAYESDETGRFEVYVRSFPNLELVRHRISTHGGVWPVWSRDGKELFFRSGNHMMVVPFERAFDSGPGTPQSLFEWNFPISFGRSYDVSPDGSRFVMVRSGGAGESPQVVLVQNFDVLLERLVPTV